MGNSRNIIYTHTGVYLLGDILRRSVSLIMLPIYTRYLTPGDYGTVELLSMLIDFASILFGARMAESIFRFYCATTHEEEKNNVISSALLLDVVLSCIGALIIFVSSSSLSTAIFSKSGFETYISLFAITMALLPLTEIPMIFIRAQQKPWLFFSFSTLKLFLQLALNIYFVVLKDMHVAGVIYRAVISSAFMALILTPYTLRKVGIKATRATCMKLVSFSFPMKLATIVSFYLTFGDRYFLNIFTDLTQVGIYSLGYKFGFIFLDSVDTI
jgi:O-antigen/teichoic acid export membrane protein